LCLVVEVEELEELKVEEILVEVDWEENLGLV
jgi:hypothetical protein